MEQGTVERRPRVEHGVMLVTLMLMGLGLVMVYSATVYSATAPHMLGRTQGNGMYFLERQLMFVGAGLLALTIASFVPFWLYRKLAIPAIVIGAFAMTSVLWFGKERLGAVRWFDLGPISVQPGEFVKLAFVMWVSYSLARKRDMVTRFSIGVIPHLAVAMLFVWLYMEQPDLGSTIILGAVLLFLLHVAGTRLKHIGMLMGGGIALVTVFVLSSAEKMRRVAAWLNPEAYAESDAYQLINSKVSIGSGGLLGEGLGSGQHNIAGYVPEGETDFIFAVIGEELGFVGTFLVIAFFAFILWRGMNLASSIRDHFARFLVFGATLLVVMQAGINIGVTTGVLPTKGLTLPFVSMGGSSMVVMCMCAGILLNASRTFPRLVREKSTVDVQVPASEVEVLVKETA
jgi:cell division protein FtsW